MKKILFMIHDLSVGGAEKVLVNLVNNMDKRKFDITVMALFGGGVNEQYLNKDIKYKAVFKKTIPGNSKIMKLFTPRQLHKWFIKDKYDIEVSYLEGPTARIISGCQNSDTRLVSWIHSNQQNRKVASMSFRSFRESSKCYMRFNKTIFVSNPLKEIFMSIYPELKHVDVLYNTNETGQILDLKKEPIEKDIFKEKEIKICGIGKIAPVKGFDRLARIHVRLRNEGYPIHTYILGIGPDQGKIEKYLIDNNLENSFTFLGYQTNPYKYLARCDMFVCASLSEGFSTATTEALIVGTPVVTTLVSGMKEMIGENNEYGVVTENNENSLYEGIKSLLNNNELLQHYKRKAVERGKTFSTANTVKAVENMLLSL